MLYFNNKYIQFQRINNLNAILSIIKKYISTGSFILTSTILYLFSDSNEYIKIIINSVLPENGKPLAFITFLGLVFIYEVCLRHKTIAKLGHDCIVESIKDLTLNIEKGRLVADINACFTEFKSSGKESITGKFYIKEIHTLRDAQIKLKVNSYSQSKIEFLIAKIKQD